MIVINGEETTNAIGLSVREYLLKAGYKAEHVVVEKNFEIISKDKYDEEKLCDGDTVEILTFMGGG